MNWRGRTIIRRFCRSRRGAAAVEFALVAPMLFALIFSTIEASWLMMQSIMLDHALDRTVRQVRVGGLAGATSEQFEQAVCGMAAILGNCPDLLTVEMIPIHAESDFPSDDARCINRNTNVSPALRYNPGGRSETVFVRACYVSQPFTPFLGLGLRMPKDATGALHIVSYSAFANEPA